MFLLGFMGCGKTTLGRALHAATGIDFVDLDSSIEHRTGMNVRQIFDSLGETQFRLLEREQLQAESNRPVIVACGGGTPCNHGNMALMNTLGTTVWLQAPVPVLVRRLRQGAAQRPLIASLNENEIETFVTQTLRMRLPSYARARYCFDSSLLETPGQIDRSVRLFIDKFLKK